MLCISDFHKEINQSISLSSDCESRSITRSALYNIDFVCRCVSLSIRMYDLKLGWQSFVIEGPSSLQSAFLVLQTSGAPRLKIKAIVRLHSYFSLTHSVTFSLIFGF